MSYSSDVNYRPISNVGEAAYTAIDAAARVVDQAFRAVMVKVRERSTVDALYKLDDRTLADIGIRRSEIRRIARKVAANPGANYRTMS